MVGPFLIPRKPGDRIKKWPGRPHLGQQIVFQEYVSAVTRQQERKERLEGQLHERVAGKRLAPVVEQLRLERVSPEIQAISGKARCGGAGAIGS